MQCDFHVETDDGDEVRCARKAVWLVETCDRSDRGFACDDCAQRLRNWIQIDSIDDGPAEWPESLTFANTGCREK